MIKIYQSLLVLGILLYDISEGCGRVPATPPPPVASTPVPTQQPSSNETFHGGKCTIDEINITRCVRDQGECFVYFINNERKPTCHCTREYKGVWCEQLNYEIIIPSTDGVAKAGIAASVAVAVVVAVVFIGALIVYYRRKRNKRKKRKRPVNGNALLPENHTQPRTDMQCKSNGKYSLCEDKRQIIEFKTTSV